MSIPYQKAIIKYCEDKGILLLNAENSKVIAGNGLLQRLIQLKFMAEMLNISANKQIFPMNMPLMPIPYH